MPPLIHYLLKRTLSTLVTLIVITLALYAIVMLTPVETRATLYLPKNLSPRLTDQQYQNLIQQVIERQHLNDPYPLQYLRWVASLLQGNWSYSPVLQEDVLEAISRRAPVTAELTLYSVLAFIPLGLVGGVMAGARHNQPLDFLFRFSAYAAAAFPGFILALILMAFFYVRLYWLAPERLGIAMSQVVITGQFRQFTGLLTLDGLLNGRPDVSLDALRHLVMPVFTLSISHWATLARITRVSMILELKKEYVLAARAHGIPRRWITWKHALRNAIAPALTSSLLSAASLLTGVFVVEIIFNFHGISEVAVSSMQFVPDAPAALGFAMYSVMVVLVLMSMLDLVLYLIDPRIRGGV